MQNYICKCLLAVLLITAQIGGKQDALHCANGRPTSAHPRNAATNGSKLDLRDSSPQQGRTSNAFWKRKKPDPKNYSLHKPGLTTSQRLSGWGRKQRLMRGICGVTGPVTWPSTVLVGARLSTFVRTELSTHHNESALMCAGFTCEPGGVGTWGGKN